MKNPARNSLLLTVATAALVMGAGLTCAQDTKENREAPGANTHGQMAPGGKMDQHPDSTRQKSPAPNAQAPMKDEKPAADAQTPAVQKPEIKGSASTGQNSETPNPHMSSSTAAAETKSGTPAVLSTEQHAKIRDTLRSGTAEHLTNVQFSTAVGEVVPGTVRLYVLPISIIEYAPQFRDYEYILVGDEILIVDPSTLRIVAVIAA
jgi:hypothetical protein